MIILNNANNTNKFWKIHNKEPSFFAIAKIEVSSARLIALTKALILRIIALMNFII